MFDAGSLQFFHLRPYAPLSADVSPLPPVDTPSRYIWYPTSASASISLWQMRKKSTHAATHLGGVNGVLVASPQNVARSPSPPPTPPVGNVGDETVAVNHASTGC